MSELKLWEQYIAEARAQAEQDDCEDDETLDEGKDNVNTSDKQKNPQPDNDPNKDGLTNPGE